MARSVRGQLTLWLVVTTLSLLTGAAVLGYLRTSAVVARHFDAAAHARARALALLVQRHPDGKLEIAPAELTMAEFTNIRHPDYLQIWDHAGKTVQRSSSLKGQDIIPPESSGRLTYWSLTLPDGRPGRGICVRFMPGIEIEPEDEPAGKAPAVIVPGQTMTLALLQDYTPVWRFQRTMAISLMAILLLSAGATMLVVPWVVRRVLKPLRLVSEQAAGIDEATLTKRFPVGRLPLELQPICQRLNDLLGRIEAAFARERRFTANVAHELRTPIAELRTLAEVAIKWPGDAESSQHNFEDALSIARQMESIVHALLSLARGQTGQLKAKREHVDVTRIIRSAWKPLADAAAARSLRFVCDVPADPFIVESDMGLLASIVSNLLQNSVDHSRAPGEIVCRIDASTDRPRLTVANHTDDLTAADLPRLIEPFWQKDTARTGSTHCGLGLSLVNTYADAIGATATFHLSDDRIFSVMITFPAGAAISVHSEASK